MKKILFIILSSLLIFGLGCTARTKTPKVQPDGATADQIKHTNPEGQPYGDSDDDPGKTPDTKIKGGGSGNNGDDDDGDGGSRGDDDDKGSKTENPTGQTPVTVTVEVEDVSTWKGKTDHAPKGFKIQEVKDTEKQ